MEKNMKHEMDTVIRFAKAKYAQYGRLTLFNMGLMRDCKTVVPTQFTTSLLHPSRGI